MVAQYRPALLLIPVSAGLFPHAQNPASDESPVETVGQGKEAGCSHQEPEGVLCPLGRYVPDGEEANGCQDKP